MVETVCVMNFVKEEGLRKNDSMRSVNVFSKARKEFKASGQGVTGFEKGRKLHLFLAVSSRQNDRGWKRGGHCIFIITLFEKWAGEAALDYEEMPIEDSWGLF